MAWIRDLEGLTILGDYAAHWSPTANELLLIDDRDLNAVSLLRADGPDFVPTVINSQDVKFPRTGFGADLADWTPDGQRVIFTGFPSGDPGAFLTNSEVWVMDKDGQNAHPVNPGETVTRDLDFVGWMDNETLVYQGYSGGGGRYAIILDMRTGEKLAQDGICGGYHHPNGHYVVVAVRCPGDHTTAISRTRQSSETYLPLSPFKVRKPEYDFRVEYQFNITFQDWLPGTNRMLLSVFTFDIYGREYASVSELVIWDLDAATMTLLAPDGLNGHFAPDGRTLAFVTLGPSRVDANGIPLATSYEPKEPLTPRYLQLLDMQTRKITLSLPISDQTRPYPDGPFIYRPLIAFSPDSRFLALLTPNAVSVDAEGKPISVIEGRNPQTHLYLLDLTTLQTNLSIASDEMTPVWSPNSDKLVYMNQNGHLAILDSSSGESTPLTTSGEERLFDVRWSFDGQYLSLNFRDDKIGHAQLAVLNVR